MKKLLILILILALSSTLLLTACAPDEPVTDDDLLYGKPRLSEMSDEEINALISDTQLSTSDFDISTLRNYFELWEESPDAFEFFSNPALDYIAQFASDYYGTDK